MIDFATLQGLTIPEGVVTQIADASGRVLWMLSGGKVILEVEKITSNTYAGETTYTGEQFILLDIYPKTNGTVKITYGGLTKTITDTSGAAEPNAQEVFFGTFNGVSDSVATPASGELTIVGDCYAFGVGVYAYSNKLNYGCGCIREILDFGKVEIIPDGAFYVLLAVDGAITIGGDIILPATVKRIDANAFNLTNIDSVIIPSGIEVIGDLAFAECKLLTTVKMLGDIPPVLTPYTSKEGVTTYRNFLHTTDSTTFEIEVPKGCGDTYKTAEGWSTYADYIVEAS
jgi:hypothetical protein